MIEFIRVDHFHVCVPLERLEEARKFYAEVIGLKEIFRPDVFGAKGHWFDISNVQLHIGVEPTLPRSIRHTALEVKDINSVKEHLKRHGVEISEEAVIPGRDRFSFLDPFGNRMELLEFNPL
jgi:catechol 2,3-dioxygenase-like lactoylglutathione lyase family enzyme